jgi:hypothetical protein
MALPTTGSALPPHFDARPRPRGHTRVEAARSAKLDTVPHRQLMIDENALQSGTSSAR